MLRTELVEILLDVSTSLKVTELAAAIKLLVKQTDADITSNASAIKRLLLECRENYKDLREKPVYESVLNDLGFEQIFSREDVLAWLTFLSRHNHLGNLRNDPEFETLRELGAWFSATERALTLLSRGLVAESGVPGQQIRLIVLDIDRSGVSVERLRNILKTVDDLVRDVMKVTDESDEGPRVSQLDSGSEFLLGIATGVQTAEFLRLLFAGYWEVLKVSKFEFIEERMKNILLGLEVLKKIDERAKDGTLDSQMSRGLKEGILRDLGRLSGYGVVPYEEREDVKSNPKLLTESRTKFLPDPGNVSELGADGMEGE